MSPDRVTSPSNALDVIPYGVTHQHLSAKLPEAVADACAVSIPGGALVIGGEKSDGTGSSKVVRLSDESSAQLVPDPDIQHPGALREGRSRHTCTTLADGSILVIGGVSGRGPNKTLRSLELFISGAPAP